jgi:hypothetical protein
MQERFSMLSLISCIARRSSKPSLVLWSAIIIMVIANCGSPPTHQQACGVSPINALPNNQVPQGSSIHRSDVVGNEEEAISFDTIITTDSVDELIDHYSKQTQASPGWVMTNSGTAEGIAWSNWKFTDSCGTVWDGSIVINQSTSTSEPFVIMRLAKP